MSESQPALDGVLATCTPGKVYSSTAALRTDGDDSELLEYADSSRDLGNTTTAYADTLLKGATEYIVVVCYRSGPDPMDTMILAPGAKTDTGTVSRVVDPLITGPDYIVTFGSQAGINGFGAGEMCTLKNQLGDQAQLSSNAQKANC